MLELNIGITKKTNVYVLCPAYLKTGGSELLHQLVYELNKNGINAYITYFLVDEKNNNCIDNDFKKYVTEYKTINEIEDEPDNLVVLYEDIRVINFSKKIKNAKKLMWWLSVDNFLVGYGLINSLKNCRLKKIIKGEIILNFSYLKTIPFHVCQSYYAIDFMKQNGIYNAEYLSDYISEEYLEIPDNWKNKKDIVVYNPKKGLKFTKKIINKSSNIQYIPIQNLTTNQVKELLQESKVYIDFGFHPGKDRLPREAAACGCCIITNKQGSAKYNNDVPINEEFKFEDEEENINNIIKKIDLCLKEYDNEIKKFKGYRKFIKQEKTKFEMDVKKIFLN